MTAQQAYNRGVEAAHRKLSSGKRQPTPPRVASDPVLLRAWRMGSQSLVF